MIKSFFQKLALVFTIICVPLVLFSQSPAKRKVEFAWEEIPNAKNYDIHFMGNTKTFKFNRNRNEIAVDVPYGSYKIKLRSRDRRGVPGAWSEEIPLVVLPLNPNLVYPLEEVSTDEENKEQITFRWKKVAGIQNYNILIYSAEGSEIENKNIAGNTFTTKLEVARGYYWQVRALTTRGLASEDEKQKNEFIVIGKKLDSPSVEVDEGEVQWEQPSFAERYDLEMEKKVGKDRWKRQGKIKSLESAFYKLNKEIASGTYKVKVRALASLRQSSDWSSKEFKIKNKNKAEIKKELEKKQERRDGFYFKANLFPAISNYEVNNNDQNTTIKLNGALGTKLVLEAGYRQPSSKWQYLFRLTGGGISTQTQAGTSEAISNSGFHVLAAREVGFVKNKKKELLILGGITARGVTELTEPSTNNFEARELNFTYLTLGLNYQSWFKEKWSYEIEALVSQPMDGKLDQQTEIEIVAFPSVESHGLVYYQWKERLSLRAGLGFLSQKMEYESLFGRSDTNEVLVLEGRLIMGLEYNF